MLQNLFEKFKKLPKLPDGRIDFSQAEEAPIFLCVVKHNGELLLLKRSYKVGVYRGWWNAVAGYIDEPMPVEEHVHQHLQQELGVTPEKISSLKTASPYHFYDFVLGKNWLIHPVVVELKEKPTIVLDEEHTAYRWIQPQEISQYDIVPGLYDSLRRLL